jgi:hypothetical protein
MLILRLIYVSLTFKIYLIDKMKSFYVGIVSRVIFFFFMKNHTMLNLIDVTQENLMYVTIIEIFNNNFFNFFFFFFLIYNKL